MSNPSYDARSTATAADSIASDQTGPDGPELGRAAGDGPTIHGKSALETPPAAAQGALNVLVNQQSAEIQRLARANEQLFDRIGAFLQIQEREQVLRQQLQNQIDRLTERLGLPNPAVDQAIDTAPEPGPTPEPAERHTADRVTEEIKPVLMAMLEVIERAFQQPEKGPKPAREDRWNPLPPEPYRTLPDILTRPIEDLLSEPAPAADGTSQSNQANPSAPEAARGPAHDAAKPARRPPEPAPDPVPSMFAWMAIFS